MSKLSNGSPAGRDILRAAILVIAGPLAYIVQLQLRALYMPWYIPVFGALGALSLIKAFRRNGGKLRLFASLVGVGVAVFELIALVVLSKIPTYSGPAQPGQVFPAFEAELADGSRFGDADLRRGDPSLVLFFRGRW